MDLTSPPLRVYHPIAPGLLDPDVVLVLRKLRRYQHEAFLVGGCVRDLLLGVTPKDFDVATAAHPREIRRIFRNSKVIGRRFRLVHIFFRDGKVIEVATFRQSPSAEKGNGTGGNGGNGGGPDDECPEGGADGSAEPCDCDEAEGRDGGDDDDLLITDDNLFGTPAEDARRRDFTINGLFYDLHTREIVDHVHGLADIEARTVRSIGDPEIRIQEDPVRILRAIKFASRLGLRIDPPLWEAMVRHRQDILRSAGPRVLEEIFRLLRCNHVLAAVALLQRSGQLEILLPEVAAYLEAEGAGQPPSLDARPPPDAGRYWRLLALLDEQIDAQGRPPDFLLLAVLLYLPLLRQLEQQTEKANLGKVVDTLVGTLVARLRLPKREAEPLRQIFVTERRLAQRRQRSGRKEALLRRGYLEEALLLHELGRRLDGEPLDRVQHLRELRARQPVRGGSPRGHQLPDEPERPAAAGPTPVEGHAGGPPPADAPRRRRRRPSQRRRPRPQRP